MVKIVILRDSIGADDHLIREDMREGDVLEMRAYESALRRSDLAGTCADPLTGRKWAFFFSDQGKVWDYAPDSKPANPKQAYGDLKVPMHLVPPALITGAAKALGEGARKYGAYNWRSSKVESMTYIGAIHRHLAAYLDGEDLDPESTEGKLHLDGIAACVAILLDATHGGFLIDNRPPKGPAPRLVLTPKKE